VALREADGATSRLEEVPRRGPCLLVSGLARPAGFEADARAAGAEAVASLRLDDHCRFQAEEAARVKAAAVQHGATWILCPEKNLSRLAHAGCGLPVAALRSRVAWSGSDPGSWLRERLRGE
jgi:tetraacyldisaccharide-1-P 4'-kinase